MIQLKNASRSYRDGEREILALSEVSLSIPSGISVALTGKSGSGKSTLLHLVGGVETPSSGQITVAGVGLHTLSDRDLTAFRLRHIGFVFQFFHLLPALSVLENLLLPVELAGQSRTGARKKAMDLLAEVGMEDRAGTAPDFLSGGEQQRVAVARALMLDPPVLLADEPTGNLDSETGGRVLDLLWELTVNRGTTVVIATHSPEIAGRTTRRIELRDGRVLADSASPATGSTPPKPDGHNAATD